MTKYPHRSPAGGAYIMEIINSLFSMFDSPVPITLTPTHPPTPLPPLYPVQHWATTLIMKLWSVPALRARSVDNNSKVN